MLYIGCHLSSSKGFAAMGRQALELGANTFQFFTRNPRGSRAKDLDPADAAALRDLLARHGFGPIVAHAPYTLNLCGAEEKNRIFARETMADDLARTVLQLPSRQPCGAGKRDRHRSHCRRTQRHPAARSGHHRSAGDHGRQGQRSRRPF